MGRTVEVKGGRQATGTITVSRVHLEDPAPAPQPPAPAPNPPAPNPPAPAPGNDDGNRGPGHEGEVEGLLSARTGSCPSIAFGVNGMAVQTSGATEFKDVSCSALADGDKVKARGSMSGSVLMATRVERDKSH